MSDGPSHASSFDENDYARPNQPWQCGWAAEGHACPLGPTKWGLCRSAHECSPYQKGDTWVCARTKTHGGTCDEGPLPDGTCCKQIRRCEPKRSALSRRGVLSFTAFAAAIASGLLILGSPSRPNLISPGPLTSQHSQVVDRCEGCHTAAAGGPTAWVQASLDREVAHTQSGQCLQCHAELGASAMNPHSQPRIEPGMQTVVNEMVGTIGDGLPELPQRRATRHGLDGGIARALRTDQQLACATCHREHRGTMADLTEFTNQQCQVCHVDSFHSFSEGHPEFTAYPYERRTRLYFDHLSHIGEHFEAAGTKGNRKCNDCHQADSAGRYMLVKEFETTCAECHSHQIQDDTTQGIAVISLPALDVDALAKNGRKIGQWPREYPLHVEATAEISPLQRLLLQSYDEYAAVEASLSGVDLRDLREADTPQLQSVESLVWLLKESLYDIVQKGHPEIHRRLATVLGEHVSESQIETLANSYPLLLAIDMQEQWLPALVTEVESRRKQLDVEVPNEVPPTDAALLIRTERHESELLASGWHVHGSSLSLRYRPLGHADRLLRALLDIGARGVNNDPNPTLLQSALNDLFDQVGSPFAAGRCTKCHSVDHDEKAAANVNWRPYEPPLDQHSFTHFNHAPHVTLLSDDACSQCHSFNETQTAATSLLKTEFIDRHWRPATNPHAFESDFVPMTQAACAKCHGDSSGRDSCLTCHAYHVR